MDRTADGACRMLLPGGACGAACRGCVRAAADLPPESSHCCTHAAEGVRSACGLVCLLTRKLWEARRRALLHIDATLHKLCRLHTHAPRRRQHNIRHRRLPGRLPGCRYAAPSAPPPLLLCRRRCRGPLCAVSLHLSLLSLLVLLLAVVIEAAAVEERLRGAEGWPAAYRWSAYAERPLTSKHRAPQLETGAIEPAWCKKTCCQPAGHWKDIRPPQEAHRGTERVFIALPPPRWRRIIHKHVAASPCCCCHAAPALPT